MVIDFWAESGRVPVPKVVQDKLSHCLVLKEWEKAPRVVFVDYPRPGGSAMSEIPRISEGLKRQTWESCLVKEGYDVKSPKPTKGEHKYLVTLYGRCSACNRQVTPYVEMDSLDVEAVERIDWVDLLCRGQQNADQYGDTHAGGHLAKPGHYVPWMKFGAALSSLMGTLPMVGMRFAAHSPHRHPLSGECSDTCWWSAANVESCPLPSRDMVARTIGKVELLLVAVVEILKRGILRARDPESPKDWVEMKSGDVEKLHVGLVYWSPTVSKSSGAEYSDPRFRYIRLVDAFDTAEEYFRVVVGQLPTSSSPRPEVAALNDFRSRALKAGSAASGAKEQLIRDKDAALNRYPPGDGCLSWWLVVEFELVPGSATARRLRRRTPVICKQQVVEPIADPRGQMFEAWTLPGVRLEASDDVKGALERLSARLEKEKH